MDLAIHLHRYRVDGGPRALAGTLAGAARAAEDGGAATLTLIDHWLGNADPRSGGDISDPMLEGYTTLGYLAHATSSIELGLLVTGVTYREPALLVKIMTTLDVLSSGRSLFGIGASWYEREHEALGVHYPGTAQRFERLEETLQICRQMWSDDDGPYRGRHYELAETVCEPRPLRRCAPPVLIAGMGERRTLDLVARYGDACNLFAIGPDGVRHKLAVLRGHCEKAGRDIGDLRKTLLVVDDPLDDPDAFLREMSAYARLGIDQVWIGPRGPAPVGWVRDATRRFVDALAQL